MHVASIYTMQNQSCQVYGRELPVKLEHRPGGERAAYKEEEGCGGTCQKRLLGDELIMPREKLWQQVLPLKVIQHLTTII